MIKELDIPQRTLKHWVKDQVNEGVFTADEVLRHGCVAGFAGLTYYKDTCALHDKFEDEIWDLVYDQSAETGEESVLKWLSTLNGAKNVGSLVQLKNLLVWFAVEHYCWLLVDQDHEASTADQEGVGNECRS